MAAYIVATVRVAEPEKFGLYLAAIAGLAEKFGGEYLVRGKVSEVLEGEDDLLEERVVVCRFPDADAARSYINSSEYQGGKAQRAGAGTVDNRLIVDPA